MALKTKIAHVDYRSKESLRFRRKYPKDIVEILGKKTFERHFQNRSGSPFHLEYEAFLRQFDLEVAEARERLEGKGKRLSKEMWAEAKSEMKEMISTSFGLEDDEAFLREQLHNHFREQADINPYLLTLLRNPDAAAPRTTLLDAKKLYIRDKNLSKDEVVRIDRITNRLEVALGPLDEMLVENLRRDHGKKYMQHMLTVTKKNGQKLSLATCQKETKIIAALINHAIVEDDLDARNPFTKLPWPKDTGPKLQKRLPLTDDLISFVEKRLSAGRVKELLVIWQLLKGTGMRLGEVVGLAQDDFALDAETPHILVRPNAFRDPKTASSIRSVPLIGETLRCAQEAVAGLNEGAPVFARYARHRGSDSASKALMKAVRAETKDKRLTVHSLRHRVSDKLRDAGAPVAVRHGFLGHSSTAIAESTYGSPRARLSEFAKWADRANL